MENLCATGNAAIPTAGDVVDSSTDRPVRESRVEIRLDSVMHHHESGMTTYLRTVGVTGAVTPAGGLAGTETASLGKSFPVNPGGAFKPKGHTPSATGVTQCVELFHQLRYDAVNQVDGTRIAVAHNIGGPTAASAVTTLEGPGTNGS
jgi:acetyl-CoA C-acetyltransferase